MILAAIILTAAAVAGVSLFILYPVIKPSARAWWPGLVHGSIGLTGLALLVAALRDTPPRGLREGAGSFGWIAAGLFAGGLLLGVAVIARRWSRKSPGVLILGMHATLAIAGIMMLLAYLSAPA